MTSFAVSRGRLESLVGKRFAAGGLRVYFAGIHSLFGGFIFLSSKKGKSKKTLVECVPL